MKNLNLFVACLLVSVLFFSCDKSKIIKNFTGSTFDGTSKGCGSFFVYKFNSDQKLAITVGGQRDDLNLSTSEQVFDLENTVGLNVGITQFNKDAISYYCNDVIEDGGPNPIHDWVGQSGTVRIQITEDSIDVNEYQVTYKLSVKLEDVEFTDTDGNTQEVDAAEFSDVLVGWLPG